jgi:SAM-dependent MidA family methyltransferase
VARIHAEIARDGPITFARFMELALYDPDGGYYRSADVPPGREGDFLTAPEIHPIFGATLSRAVADAWEKLDRPDAFVLREVGAGTGALAVAVLEALAVDRPDLAAIVRYDPIEVDERRLTAIDNRLHAVGFATALLDPAASGRPIDGVVVANEVLDALPTHRVIAADGELLERFVGSRDGAFVEVDGAPSTPRLAARLAAEGIALADGQEAEVCLALDPWIADVAAGLRRGLVLLIDYGYPAAELYDPMRRHDGTLRAYLRHRVHDDPLIHVGRQDLTAHVDVTAVERAATAVGLEHLGTTTQSAYLIGLGIEDRLRAIQTDPATTMEAYLALRSSIVRLLDPRAMGRFRVMAFGQGWPDGPPPGGLDPGLGR